MIWENYGARIFIGLNEKLKAIFLTNQIWRKKNKQEYFEWVETGESRHAAFADYIEFVDYNTHPSAEQFENSLESVPDTAMTNVFKLTFGDNKNLEITENVKIIEAYRHN